MFPSESPVAGPLGPRQESRHCDEYLLPIIHAGNPPDLALDEPVQRQEEELHRLGLDVGVVFPTRQKADCVSTSSTTPRDSDPAPSANSDSRFPREIRWRQRSANAISRSSRPMSA